MSGNNLSTLEKLYGISFTTGGEKKDEDLPPTLVWPGTEEAYRRGCTCPVEENMKRMKDGAWPKLTRNCIVHSKVCQAERCECTGEHTGAHMRCEHCTNKLHVCVVCEAVYLEDGDDPAAGGWSFVDDEVNVRGWYCGRCS